MGCSASSARETRQAPVPDAKARPPRPFHPDPLLEASDISQAPPDVAALRDAHYGATANPSRNPLRPPALRCAVEYPAALDDNAGDSIFDARQATPALTMSEFCTEMHLRRIEGRGNMARMHGYTADIHQFPAPAHPLTFEQLARISARCTQWMAATGAPPTLA